MKVSDEDIKRIISLFENTNKTLKNICKEVKVSREDLQKIMESYYLEKGVKEPFKHRPKKNRDKRIGIQDEEIYELREQGLTYEAIAKCFTNQGKKISGNSINNRCKKIYLEKGKEEPKVKSGRKIIGIADEEIYELREQGLTYEAIAKYFTNQGKKISGVSISKRCERIYKEKGQEKQRKHRNTEKTRTGITDEEIYELREQGLTYEAIVKHFTNQGKKISKQAINNRCKRIYERKGKEIPKAQSKIGIIDEEIYNLREQGLSYRKIAEYFTNQGKKISWGLISNRCKRIYEEKGQEESKIKRKSKTGIEDEEIFELREQGLSYKFIAEHFTKQGRKVSWNSIYNRCKKIYEEKGQKEPMAKTRQKSIDITNEEIYNLREQGLSCKAIAEYFINRGKNISDNWIYKRCKKIYEEKGQKEPMAKVGRKLNNNIRDEEIYRLREQGLSCESIARYFTNQGESISQISIFKRCKKIYKEKGREEPKAKRIARKLNNNIRDEEKEQKERNIDNKDLAKAIMNLIVTRKASLEQIKKIAEIYEVDLNEVLNDYIDER